MFRGRVGTAGQGQGSARWALRGEATPDEVLGILERNLSALLMICQVTCAHAAFQFLSAIACRLLARS